MDLEKRSIIDATYVIIQEIEKYHEHGIELYTPRGL